jgi:hypothetical protein
MNEVTAVQVLNVFAMSFAMTGSALFVHGRYEEGAKTFLLGNAMNIAVAVGVGDVAFGAAQAALAGFTFPMFTDRKFVKLLGALFAGSLASVGIAGSIHFTIDPVSFVGAVLAIYGAYAMSKAQWKVMAWMWIVADLLFIWVGIHHGLLGLTIQSLVFVYHGCLRVTGVKQTGLFTFQRS